MQPMMKVTQKQITNLTDTLLLVGTIGSSHGLNGLVKLTSFMTKPSDIANFDLLQDDSGRTVKIELTGKRSGGTLVAQLEGVKSREEALAMKGKKLFAHRNALPETMPEEWYCVDLIGLKVFNNKNKYIGKVHTIEDHGAGDIVEIMLENGELLSIPFTRHSVPSVDILSGQITVVIPTASNPVGNDKSELNLENRK